MVSDFWFVGVMDPAWYVDEWVGCVKHAWVVCRNVYLLQLDYLKLQYIDIYAALKNAQ